MQDPDTILYQLNHYKPLIDKANKITEEYVSKHKLILTGGMAIDLALRVEGSHIYEDDALPDYDIISDCNLDHANALATLMCKEGLPDVNVINAVHITTVRVRMKNITFLDATYIPPSCFKKIPYMDVGHLRVVHPHYQFIDQRLSLATLMVDTGLSLNIFNRLSKDVNRNELLRSNYPIVSELSTLKTKKVSVPIDMIRLDESKINNFDPDAFVYTGPTCVAGYLGVALMNRDFKVVDDAIEISLPEDFPIRLLTCDYDSIKDFIKRPKMYRPLINLKPISLKSGDYEFVDTYGSRIGCNSIEVKKGVRVCVASVDYLLMELLRDRIYVSEEPHSYIYSKFVDKIDTKRNEQGTNAIWYPSLNTYGYDNLPEYRVVMLESAMDEDNKEQLKPKNSYLRYEECKTKKGFVQEDSHYFLIDGAEDKKLHYTNHKHIVDKFKSYVEKKK